MQLMDRMIVNDGVAKVIDLGFHAFDEFFKMSEEIGFMKEAARRGVAPIILFVGRYRPRLGAGLRHVAAADSASRLVTIDNEFVVRGELPPAFAHSRVLEIARAAGVPEDLYRPADLLVHGISAHTRRTHRPNCINGSAATISASASWS